MKNLFYFTLGFTLVLFVLLTPYIVNASGVTLVNQYMQLKDYATWSGETCTNINTGTNGVLVAGSNYSCPASGGRIKQIYVKSTAYDAATCDLLNNSTWGWKWIHDDQFEGHNLILSPSLDEVCEIVVPCDDEMNAALLECDGDAEQVQVFSLEEGSCDIRCTPCVLEDDVMLWSDPEIWTGISYEDAIEKCGGLTNVSYDSDECVGTCQDESCDQQYAALAAQCGGTQYIDTWNEEDCSGTCIECSNEVIAANNECGENLWSMDENCDYSCNTCMEKFDDCVAQCGSEENILNFSCDDSENYLSECSCKDQPLIPTVPPEVGTPTTIIKKVDIVYNGDDTATETTTTTTTDTETGETVEETVVTDIAADGTRTETSRTWIVSNDESSENPVDDNDEIALGEEDEEEYTSKTRSIDFAPLLNSGSGITEKFPISLVAGAVGIFQDFEGVGAAPSFSINIHGHILNFDMSFFDPIALLLKGLFSMVLVVGGAFTILRQWM